MGTPILNFYPLAGFGTDDYFLSFFPPEFANYLNWQSNIIRPARLLNISNFCVINFSHNLIIYQSLGISLGKSLGIEFNFLFFAFRDAVELENRIEISRIFLHIHRAVLPEFYL